MATTSHAAIAIEKAHNRALEIVRERGGDANAERVAYLDNLGHTLASVNFPAQLSSAQSVLIAALAEIIQQQDRRIAALENPAPAATAAAPPKKGTKKA